MKTYTIHPRDVLFFRDARPMQGSSEGAGAGWPLPSVLHSAMLSAFHDRWTERCGWESEHKHLTDRENRKFGGGQTTSMRFGGLKTVGPFPACCGDVLVPTPADLTAHGIMQPVQLAGESNLPVPLKYAVAATTPPSKERPGDWVSLLEFRKYLQDSRAVDTVDSAELFLREPRPGVGIDPETHANRESVFFQAEYLRLQRDVSMVFQAEAEAKKYGEKDGKDLLKEFFAGSGLRQPIILGGQRGVAYAQKETGELFQDMPLPAPCTRIKWVLLTPALFGVPPRKDEAVSLPGWRPDWVAEDGRVMLKSMPDRAGFPNRKAWRQAAKSAPNIDARLVAARIPKPLPVSGWKLEPDSDHAGGAPKPTRLLVPPGAVYYFECESADAAKELGRQLHGKVKSQRLGEKGFGFGFCGTWELMKQ